MIGYNVFPSSCLLPALLGRSFPLFFGFHANFPNPCFNFQLSALDRLTAIVDNSWQQWQLLCQNSVLTVRWQRTLRRHKYLSQRYLPQCSFRSGFQIPRAQISLKIFRPPPAPTADGGQESKYPTDNIFAPCQVRFVLKLADYGSPGGGGGLLWDICPDKLSAKILWCDWAQIFLGFYTSSSRARPSLRLCVL